MIIEIGRSHTVEIGLWVFGQLEKLTRLDLAMDIVVSLCCSFDRQCFLFFSPTSLELLWERREKQENDGRVCYCDDA